MPLLQGARPLKRWRYCGVYGDELMLCAATVRIGGIPQAFWAVLDRASGRLLERTSFTRSLVAVGDGRVRVPDAASTSSSRFRSPASRSRS